jgi:hypothetical protein
MANVAAKERFCEISHGDLSVPDSEPIEIARRDYDKVIKPEM